MPSPWNTAAQKTTRIAAIEDRAMSVKQLRDVRILLQRLCKTGLLKKTIPVRGGQVKVLIHWFDINMYDIRGFVIIPVIEFMEKKRGTNDRYSWAELVSRRDSQPPALLFSHFWGGRFRDFMSIVDKVVEDKGLSSNATIWVCTFANSQFGESFGQGLTDSPFCKAIKAAQGLVLVVDRESKSLTRIWCSLELHLAVREKKALEIYTPSGRVGSEYVTSGPLVISLQDFDVTYAEASQESDRRQILNFLADESREKDGLKLDSKGNFEVKNGWQKELSVKTLTTGDRLRGDGTDEYAHEASLFESAKEKFEKLNNLVRSEVQKVTQTERQMMCSWGSSEKELIVRPLERGVTLGQFRSFTEEVRRWITKNSFEGRRSTEVSSFAGKRGSATIDDQKTPVGQLPWSDSWSQLTVKEVHERFILGCTLPNQSYMETLADAAQRPQIMIEYSWHMPFSEFVSSVEWLVEARKLRDSTVLWIDILALRHATESLPWQRAKTKGQNDLDTAIDLLDELLDDCSCMFSIYRDQFGEINRLWRLLPLQMCFEKANQMDFGCPTGALACTSPFPEGGWEFGRFDPEIARKLMQTSFMESTSPTPTMKERVKLYLEEHGGVTASNERIRRISAGPVLRDAAFHGDEEHVQELRIMCEHPGFLINSSSLKGSLGETAVHIAAARGNVQALQAVLDAKADPNAEDTLRETPLHYVALTGQLACARLLLENGAITTAESAFAETPLRVSIQNVAEYLGVRTEDVSALLSAWDKARPVALEKKELHPKPREIVMAHCTDKDFEGGFYRGQLVRRRYAGGVWGVGYVKSLLPLKVTINRNHTWRSEEGFVWEEVAPLDATNIDADQADCHLPVELIQAHGHSSIRVYPEPSYAEKHLGEIPTHTRGHMRRERDRFALMTFSDDVSVKEGWVAIGNVQLTSPPDEEDDLLREERPCPSGCGFQITWHATHCCGICETLGTRCVEHGPKCDKLRYRLKCDTVETLEKAWSKAMTQDLNNMEAVPSFTRSTKMAAFSRSTSNKKTKTCSFDETRSTAIKKHEEAEGASKSDTANATEFVKCAGAVLPRQASLSVPNLQLLSQQDAHHILSMARLTAEEDLQENGHMVSDKMAQPADHASQGGRRWTTRNGSLMGKDLSPTSANFAPRTTSTAKLQPCGKPDDVVLSLPTTVDRQTSPFPTVGNDASSGAKEIIKATPGKDDKCCCVTF